jgi:hypothetical protein
MRAFGLQQVLILYVLNENIIVLEVKPIAHYLVKNPSK